MIEGPSATGKSLLAQYVTSGALDNGLSVAYFASQHTPRSLEAQVKSIGMDWSEHLKSEKLVVCPLQAPVTGQDSGVARGDVHGYGTGPEQASNHYLGCHHKSGQFQPRAGDHRFLHHLQAAHKHGPDHLIGFTFGGLQRRPVSPCFIDVRDKVVRVVKVAKLDDVDRDKDNEASFGVEPGIGISIIPYSSAKA